MLFEKHKTIYFGILVVISAIAVLIVANFVLAEEQPARYDIAGWFWSDNYGWISLNSENSGLMEFPSQISYKVVSENNEFYGWGWSSNVGWVCFGKTCSPNNICANAPAGTCQPFDFGSVTPVGGWRAAIDPNSKLLTGWAKVVSLKDSGLIHLGSGAVTNSNQNGTDCYDCKYDTSTPPKLTGCNTCFTRTKFDNQNLPDNQIDSVVGGSGNACQKCVNCRKHISQDLVNYRISCESCSICRLYGGLLDSDTGGLLGWGWNGNDDPLNSNQLGADGAGWVEFNAMGGVVYPWLQTVYGAVFSRNRVKQKSVVSGVNATYCIFAKDVYNFRSSNCAKSISSIDIKFPQKYNDDQSYKNVLGRIDVKGLSTKTRTASNINYNKYNNVIIERNGNQVWSSSNVLNNAVYVINGNLTVRSGFTIKNSQGNERGNGLIVVNGDLIIESDFDYDNSSIVSSNLKDLASVAWVVKGDVIVGPAVKRVVGAFVVLGNNDNCLYDDGGSCSTYVDYPKYRRNGYGVFFSETSGNPLVVSGLLVAKAFDFRRTYSDIKQGSEKIIYDGRLIANPPPGMKGFIEGLPVIRDFEF